MADEQEDLLFMREALAGVIELQAQIGALQLVIQQKTAITLEDIQSARAELERRFPSFHVLQKQIRKLGREDLFAALRNHAKDFGPQ